MMRNTCHILPFLLFVYSAFGELSVALKEAPDHTSKDQVIKSMNFSPYETTNSNPYALISPVMGERIRESVKTHAAQRMRAWAVEDLKKSPKAVPRVHTEGTLPHQGIFDESVVAQKDWSIMLNLAVAWKLTGDSRYLRACEKYLDAWLAVYTTNLNPIDETKLEKMFFAYDLTRMDLSEATRGKMDLFLKKIAEGYLHDAEKTRDHENWQSHRIKLATLAAYSLGDKSMIERSREAFRKQIKLNINPDGSVIDFRTRDALHYVVYDLEPLVVACLAAKAHGEDWFHHGSGDSSSVEAAVDWLTPFALGEKTHEEFVHSKATFDAKRAKAGIRGYSGIWEPCNSTELYQMAAFVDSKYAPIAGKIISESGQQPNSWLEILREAIGRQ
jgi:hypothetical protein